MEDTSAPYHSIGDTNVTHEAGSDYTDLGATGDAVDGNGTLPELAWSTIRCPELTRSPLITLTAAATTVTRTVTPVPRLSDR